MFIDYYQLIKSGPEFIKRLKFFAEDHSITIVILSQLESIVDKMPLDLPELSCFMGLSDQDYIDEYYYLIRPVYYRITKTAAGSNVPERKICSD